MSQGEQKPINPVFLLVVALIGGGGTNLGINALNPPDAPDRYTGSQADARNRYVDNELKRLETRIDEEHKEHRELEAAVRKHDKEAERYKLLIENCVRDQHSHTRWNNE